MSTLIDRIKLIRKEEGLNQTQFAEKLGLQRTIISLCESGKRNFSERTLKDIAAEFHINLEWLRTGEGDMYDEESEDAVIDALKSEYDLDDIDVEIIRNYINMAPIERQVFKNYVKSISDKKKKEL